MALRATAQASRALMPKQVAAALAAAQATPPAEHPGLHAAQSIDGVDADSLDASRDPHAKGFSSNSLRLLRMAENAYTRALERDPLNDEVATEILVTRVMLLSDPARSHL